jgi:hypothetical protein
VSAFGFLLAPLERDGFAYPPMTALIGPLPKVIFSPWLHPKPRPIPFRFSGGVNETRREFNERRLAEWEAGLSFVVDKANDAIIFPASVRAEVEAALEKLRAR